MTDDEMALAALLARTERARARLERDNEDLHEQVSRLRAQEPTRHITPTAADMFARAVLMARAGVGEGKIGAIKEYRTITGAGLRESKEAVEELMAWQPEPSIGDILKDAMAAGAK